MAGIPSQTRPRIIAAAIDLTVSKGWPAVTMAHVAEGAGVTRQTVYNEIGTKPDLAEAMVLHELAAFLSVVDSAFDDHPEDAVSAVRDATRRVLALSRTHPLLGSILAREDSTDLLPLVTSRADAIHDAAATTITRRLDAYSLPITAAARRRSADVIVRLTLSHLVRPQSAPPRAANDIAWVAERLFTTSW